MPDGRTALLNKNHLYICWLLYNSNNHQTDYQLLLCDGTFMDKFFFSSLSHACRD